jgi:hypothetical protein
MAIRACSVVRMSLKSISWACSERPEVCTVLELLAALVGAVLVLHRHRPDAAGDAADHGVFRVHAVAEEEGEVGREVVDVHAAGQVARHSEAVGQREGELADRVGAGFGDVIAGDRHRVEVLHLVVHKERLDVAHHLEGELGG